MLAWDLEELLPLFFLSFSGFLVWKYLEITFISFLDLAGRGGGGRALLIMTGVDLGASFLELLLVGGLRGVNFDEILVLSVLVLWSVNNISYLDPYTDEMKFHIASPIPSKSERSFALDIFGQEVERDFDVLGVRCKMFDRTMERNGVE